ncbi:MAG: hypothetical protein H7Z14_05780 [Anaerolineae bacterium]|nr:hypothetical protein [Phycisphaerae bacterium]
MQKGERVGFREDDSGNVVGIVGDKELPVVGLAQHATHVMWYHKSRKPTQFGKSIAKTGDFLQQLWRGRAGRTRRLRSSSRRRL